MHSALCKAIWRCHVRRSARVVATAPLLAVILVGAVVAAPPVLFIAGRVLGGELEGAIGAAGVADALVLGPMLAFAAAGSWFAGSLSGSAALGAQLAVAPLGRVGATVAVTLVPLGGVAVIVLPGVLATSIALGRTLPGGAVAGAALTVGVVAAAAAGATVAEAALAAGRGHRRRAGGILLAMSMWPAAGLVLGATPLGPLAPVGAALRGDGSPAVALAIAFAATLVLAGTWVALAAARPVPRRTRARAVHRIVVAGRLPRTGALVAALTRRTDVRLALVAAAAFGGVATALGAIAAGPAPVPFLFGATTALFGAIFCPLVVCGMLLDGSWLWQLGPTAEWRIATEGAVVSIAGVALPVALVGAAGASSGGAMGSVGGLVALGVCAWAISVLAGAVVPWRGTGAGAQFTSFAALAGLAIATSLLVGVLAPRLVALGIPDEAVATLVCASLTGLALLSLRHRLGLPTG